MTILLSLAALAAAVPAVPATPAPTRIVHHGDLDLTSARDRLKLDRRLFRAAAEVCGETEISRFDVAGQNAARSCRTATVSAARTEAAARADRRAVQVAAIR